MVKKEGGGQYAYSSKLFILLHYYKMTLKHTLNKSHKHLIFF